MKKKTKMKKIACLLFAGVMAFSLAACGKKAEAPAEPEGEKQETEAQEPEAEHSIVTPQAVEGYLPVTVSYEYDFRSAEDGTTLVSGKCPVIELRELSLKDDGTAVWRTADGYEKLSEAVDDWNKSTYVSFKNSMDRLEADAKEAYGTDRWIEGTYYSDESTVTVTRADAALLSLLISDYCDAGGAHPSTGYSSAVFDSQTGELLQAEDLVKDADAFVATAAQEMVKAYPDIADALIVDNLTDGIRDMALKAPYDMECTLTGSGMNLGFSAGALTAYAYGPEFVTLSFDAYPDLFNEKVGAAAKEYFLPLAENVTTGLPTGQRLSWYLETATTADGADDLSNYKLHITVDGHDTAFPAGISYAVKAYGLFMNNKYYLYCDGSADNDWHFLSVYEISGSGASCISGDNGIEGGFYDCPPVDPENFLLQNRSYVCGTEQAGCMYSVGADGLPKANSAVWTYIITDEDGELISRTLTAKQDVKLLKMQDALDYSSAGEETLVKAGTVLTLLTTNSNNPGIVEASAILKNSAGNYYRLTETANPEESGYVHMVDGKEISDVFDGLTLAG